MSELEPYVQAREILTPSSLNRRVRELIDGTFPLLWLEGEISNLARPGSGHVYFTLKDELAQVRCAMFRSRALLLRLRPAEGMHVLLRAKASLYEGRGEFQLVVEHMEEAGEGALRRAFEQLKARLQAEGLFELARKRALPRFPRRLGVLTSVTGAAVRDVLSVLRRRYPLVEVEIFPVPVQGAEAAGKLVATLRAVAAAGRHDVLLVTRGGGSLEDLWPFNDESLARAIAASAIPVVSAIGHEVDFTIADFVADLRAPTPSVAAELLTPHRDDLSRLLQDFERRFVGHVRRLLSERAQRLDAISARLVLLKPALRLSLLRERLQRLEQRLQQTRAASVAASTHRLALLRARLDVVHPRTRVIGYRDRSSALRRSLSAAAVGALTTRAQSLAGLARALNAVSPLATLDRGYAILFDAESGRVVRSARSVSTDRKLRARLADGSLDLRVERLL